jgi:hypothetical protein
MFQKTLFDLCVTFVCHLLVFDWMRGLPRWAEAFLFIGLVTLISNMVLRTRRPKGCSPGVTLQFYMRVGRMSLMLALGPKAYTPITRLKGE